MLHVDGRIVQSIRRLLLSPGFLTREYLQGRRARWISPIRLYLIFSVVFFALSTFTPMRVGIYESRSRSGWFSIRNTPQARVAVTGDEDEDAAAKKLGYDSFTALRDAVNHAILTWVPRVMFVLLPFFASLVALAYRRVDRNYLHHLMFAVHVHAAWFAVGSIAKAVELAFRPIGNALDPLVILFAGVYTVLAFRRVYGKISFSFARIAFVIVAYVVAFTVAFAAIVLPLFLPQILTRPS